MLHLKKQPNKYNMGAGREYHLNEIDETKAAAADEAFEGILERVKEAGGEITKDESAPLYAEIGVEEAEIGYERVVEFTLKKFDFMMIRKVENQKIMGDGRTKSLEPLSRPRIKTIMKRKPEISDTWQIVDLEEMF